MDDAKEDYTELWYERMRLEFISGYGVKMPQTERDQAAPIRIAEILKQSHKRSRISLSRS